MVGGIEEQRITDYGYSCITYFETLIFSKSLCIDKPSETLVGEGRIGAALI